jgi:hypothetical protein
VGEGNDSEDDGGILQPAETAEGNGQAVGGTPQESAQHDAAQAGPSQPAVRKTKRYCIFKLQFYATNTPHLGFLLRAGQMPASTCPHSWRSSLPSLPASLTLLKGPGT